MPFKSEAQRRYMYATDPKMAKRWEKETKDKKLPEKLHPDESIPRSEYAKRKKSTMTKKADGMFFEKRAKPRRGRFFADLAGRDDGNFHEKTAFTAYPPGVIPKGGGINVSPQMGAGPSYGAGAGSFDPSKVTKTNVGSTGGAVGGTGQKGEGMAGDMQSPAGMYGAGKGREKKAYESPTTPEFESGYPTGFHRPASEQPEALESGGTRFQSTEAKPPSYGSGTGVQSTTNQARMRRRATSGPQLGKHAMYLGTSYALEKSAVTASEIGQNVVDTASTAGKNIWETSKKTLGELGQTALKKVEEKSKDPAWALGTLGAGALGAGLLGRGLARGVGRGAKRLWRGKTPPPPTLAQRVGSKIKSAFS